MPDSPLTVITRDDALRIGASEIVARGLGIGARKALLIGEIMWARPVLYSGHDLDECWIVCAERDSYHMIRSSNIVLLSRKTGEVLYAGSACDEG